MTEEFRKFRWKGLFITSYFNDFVAEKISPHFFKSTSEDDKNQAIQASGLLAFLEEVYGKIAKLHKRKDALELEIQSIRYQIS